MRILLLLACLALSLGDAMGAKIYRRGSPTGTVVTYDSFRVGLDFIGYTAGTYEVRINYPSGSFHSSTQVTVNANLTCNPEATDPNKITASPSSPHGAQQFQYSWSVKLAGPNNPVIASGVFSMMQWEIETVAVGATPTGQIIQLWQEIPLGTPPECPDRESVEFELGLIVSPKAGGQVRGGQVVTLEVEGSVVYSYTLPSLFGENFTAPVRFNLGTVVDTTPGAFTYAWKVDGVVVADGMYQCADEASNASDVASVQETGNAPGEGEHEQTMTSEQDKASGGGVGSGETTTTVTGKDGAMGAPGTPGTNTSQTTTFPPSSGGGGGQEGDELTQAEVYDAVRSALDDAGNSLQAPVIAKHGQEEQDFHQERGRWEELEDVTTEVTTGLETVRNTVLAKFAGNRLDWLSASLGTVNTIDFGSFAIGSRTVTLSVSLNSGVGSIVPVMRQVILYVLWICMAVTVAHTVKGYI